MADEWSLPTDPYESSGESLILWSGDAPPEAMTHLDGRSLPTGITVIEGVVLADGTHIPTRIDGRDLD